MTGLFSDIAQTLASGKIENPLLETRLMFAHVLEISPSQIYSSISVNDVQKNKLWEITKLRLQHKPLDKILGHKGFYKSDFVVNNDVLSPRFDTEILVENALNHLALFSAPKILDLGTGSGCIIESILLELPEASGTAVDISSSAIKTAKINAERLKVGERVKFIQADWFSQDFIGKIGDTFDMIVSNPPYIPSDEINLLEREVRENDPLIALDGGKDGYDSYARIASLAGDLLKDDGIIILEAGIFQARKIAEIFSEHGFITREIICDLGGIERCVILQKVLQNAKKASI